MLVKCVRSIAQPSASPADVRANCKNKNISIINVPNWSVPASSVSDSGNCNSISLRLLPGNTHWLTRAKSRDIISLPVLISNSSPSSLASSNSMCENTKLRPLMAPLPYDVPDELRESFSKVMAYKSWSVVLAFSKSFGGNPSKRSSWCKPPSVPTPPPVVWMRMCPERPNILHCAPLTAAAGILREMETSSLLPRIADFHVMALASAIFGVTI